MILSRALRLVFIKTKKVGGTSFEIALSKYCDADDIITPITPNDELIREKLCFQGPINFSADKRSNSLLRENVKGEFYNHMNSAEINKNLENSIFNSYTMIAIQREATREVL